MRDCNPFFHCMEGIWMLAGRNDVEWIGQFNSSFKQFSDDGETFWGAYGHRWRNWFGVDQLLFVIDELDKNKKSRRAVMQMWDASKDPERAKNGGKDVPCNTTVFFKVVKDKLMMQVCNRSNDIFWGAYGANAVHMSMMQEFIARSIGVEVGVYYQSSWNFHAYTDVYPVDSWEALGRDAMMHDYYSKGLVKPYPLMTMDNPVAWLADANLFINGFVDNFIDPFFFEVAVPMQAAWQAHKQKDYHTALHHADSIAAHDWRLACKGWLERRAEAYRLKQMEIAK